jgi:regulator of sigma E protease
LTGQQIRMGLPNLFFLVALISLNLGILNLLPMPVLDGGHIFFVVLEIIFRRPVSLKIRERAQQVGVFFLIMFMVFLIYNDVSRIINQSGPVLSGPGQEKVDSETEPER